MLDVLTDILAEPWFWPAASVIVGLPIVLLGAGSAGAELARELLARPVLGLLPVAFVDDDPAKRGLVIHGVPVEGPYKPDHYRY